MFKTSIYKRGIIMLCERCGNNPASVHVTHINNGEKTEMYLCEQCAKETESIHFQTPISFQDFLTGLLDMPFGNTEKYKNYIDQKEVLQCQNCKMTYDEFRKTGRFGCAECYSAFYKQLTPIIKKLHGNNIHTGKLPNRAAGELKVKRELEMLRKELKKAIEMEEYEKAASLRDRIRALEGGENR
jgi:protein arginine kinase activator